LQRILFVMDRRTPSPSRFALVPRASHGGNGGGPRFKRYSLARVQPSPRSALGEDRHERLERAAGRRPRRA
jgi:hypothetical protein